MTQSALLRDDGLCFGCGPDNSIGLRLTFTWDGDTYGTLWTPLREHQGWAGRVHGGLLALVLDETLSRAALDKYGLEWVTAELTTRLVAPASVGTPLSIDARITNVHRALIVCEGRVQEAESRRLVATGRAKLMRPK